MYTLEDMIKDYLVQEFGERYTVDFPIQYIDVTEKQDGDFHVSITYHIDYGNDGGIIDEYTYETITKTDLMVWLWSKTK